MMLIVNFEMLLYAASMKRFVLRLDDKFHAQLFEESQALGRSLHAHLIWCLERRPPASKFLKEASARLPKKNSSK